MRLLGFIRVNACTRKNSIAYSYLNIWRNLTSTVSTIASAKWQRAGWSRASAGPAAATTNAVCHIGATGYVKLSNS